jgi:serine/threonine protein kinase
LVRQVAEGMAYLHSRGVVHFLLTPTNILLGGHDRLAARVGG